MLIYKAFRFTVRFPHEHQYKLWRFAVTAIEVVLGCCVSLLWIREGGPPWVTMHFATCSLLRTSWGAEARGNDKVDAYLAAGQPCSYRHIVHAN